MSGFDEKLRAWFFLFRPWSYTATVIPFLLAAGFVFGFCGSANWGRWGLGLVAGLLFQSTVNLLNTWGDERSGVDNVPGAIRTTPQVHDGLVSLNAVLVVGLCCAALASLIGVGLCFHRAGDAWYLNKALLVAGFIGFLGSLNYSTGIKFKYRGLGVPFVSFLMGPLEIFVALALLKPQDSVEVALIPPLLVAFALVTLPNAALVGVIMHGNDMRDIPSDRAAGIVTLASRLGPRGALAYYRICHILPYGVCLVLITLFQGMSLCAGSLNLRSFVFLLPFLCLPLTIKTLRTAVTVYRSCPENPPWRGLERNSGGILFVFGILYSLSFLLLGLLSR